MRWSAHGGLIEKPPYILWLDTAATRWHHGSEEKENLHSRQKNELRNDLWIIWIGYRLQDFQDCAGTVRGNACRSGRDQRDRENSIATS